MPSSSPRRDGFDGQRMVSLPEPIREMARGNPLLRGLYVTDAGYFPSANQHLVDRPQGAPSTLIILCLRGTGWYRIDGKQRAAQPGDLVWLPAGQAHTYGAGDDAWTIAWAHFSGEEVASWRTFLGQCASPEDATFKLPVNHLDEIGLERVHPILEQGSSPRHLLAASTALRSSLCKVGELLVERRGMRTARDRVVASVEALRRDWLRPHRLEEMATTAGMSVTHYCAHFRELTGFAPIDYLIRLRVRHAAHLLDTSKLTVAEVAAAVGYNDPYYFTRCFRRVMGSSPLQYRRIPKG